ncbi:amino acid adenylation domain-containing protein [Streptomyces sp. S465]|uniref:amino acid adenylation domain-containing protein n=1 Tax=Streptomyces sp. S465 TaxID=2979468 RepID=UPI0022A87EC5|nr:amino acid adenylation domain-containing protein [Streptomyces sp. S465]WAP60337.1 amino acid adenylation domain-containing protein [Streptomyces sp. S465]
MTIPGKRPATLRLGGSAKRKKSVTAQRGGPVLSSFAQRRIWFLQQLDPDSNAYNLPLVQRLRGLLDAPALERALALVVARHEALRTVFDTADGEPLQRVLPAPEHILRHARAGSDEDAARLVRDEIAAPFDLATGPVIRALLIRLGDDDHVLAVTVHHVAGDGWSFGLLQHELAAHYTALRDTSRPAELPPLPVQYADFAAWERRELTGAGLDRRLAYWREQLRGAPARLALPTDRPRPPVADADAGMAEWRPPAALATAVLTLARDSGASVFMTLLAAFQAVLARQAGTRDVLVGTPVANRTRAAYEGLIGMFVNTLALRGDLSGDPSFRELLDRCRATTTDAFAHADLPFENVIELVAPERDLSVNPVVQVLLQVLRRDAATAALPGIAAEPFRTGRWFTRFDLEFHVYEEPGGALTGELLYSRALFDEPRITGLLEEFTAVLQAVTADPDVRLSPLPAGDATAAAPVVPSNDTARDLPVDTLPGLLARYAARTPGAVAVTDPHTSLTYAQLDRRANRLAHLLRAHGTATGDLVGICADRGADLIVGIVGILKAGAAYVPLDPEHPPERTAFVLADAQLTTVVAHEGYRSRFPDVPHVVALDDPELDRQPDDTAPDVELDRDSLAYAIYTSGSTGRPKAVLMPGVSAVNLLLWQERTMGREPASRTVQFVTPTFDYSVQEIFSALLGGTLVIPPDEVRFDPPGLARWMDEQAITRIYAPTAVLRALIEHVDPHSDQLAALRHLCQGGEALILDTRLRELCRHRPHLRVHNHYGPAESQLITGYTLPADPDAWPATAPIGPPIDNTRIHLLDEAMRPVPDGMPGQLCVAGVGLARGYLARPELTAERWVPGGAVGEERMYLTGDLARRAPDGDLEFLGRIDDQVKIRGIRVEPGEIESLLAEDARVTQAAVSVREDRRGEKFLAAYVVPVAGRHGDDFAASLRAGLAARLPAALVPSAVVLVERLPRTTSGKVDRRALPDPEPGPASTGTVTPRTDAERTVCRIFQEVLDVPRVGADDDFFTLGGHSLLATRVVSRIRAELGADVPLRTLFDGRTPAALARAADEAGPAALPPIPPSAENGPAPLTAAQEQMLHSHGSLLAAPSYTVAPYGFRLRGPLDREALDAALTRIAARHEPLRTGFRDREQVVRPPAPVRAEVVPVPAGDVDAAVRVAHRELTRPFDLVDGSLLRAVLLPLDAEDHVLLLMLHHLAGDGWSFDLLVRELSGTQPDLPVSYTDVARWERSPAVIAARENDRAYWRRQLGGATAPELSAVRPGGAPTGRAFLWTLEDTAVLAARRVADAHDATLHETVLGAFALVVAETADTDDVLVATPFADRGYAGTDHLIGFFAKVLALRLDLGGTPSFPEVLRRVHTAMVGAHAHQAVPYSALRAEDPALPPAPVSFQLISALSAELRLPGMHTEPFPVVAETVDEMTGELSINLFDDGRTVSGAVVHDAALLDRATVDDLLTRVEATLRAAAGDLTVRVTGYVESE